MDDRLIAKAQAGDRGALESLVRAYDQPMLRFFLRMSKDIEFARDLRQELFCKLLVVLPKFDARRSTFKTWLYRIARNLAIDRIYRRKQVEVLSSDEQPIIQDSAQGSEETPHKIAYVRELESAVARAISRLPELDQSIIALKNEASLSFAEIGKMLGMPESTLKSRLYRAFELLRKDLTAQGHNWAGGEHHD